MNREHWKNTESELNGTRNSELEAYFRRNWNQSVVIGGKMANMVNQNKKRSSIGQIFFWNSRT